MNYQQTIDYMFSRLPMYQRVGMAAYKPGLEKTIKLLEILNNPQHQFKSIHIAGTNGKGSTSHFIASALMEKGLKTALYTSPHLKDYRERITINGEMIPQKYVVDFIAKYKDEFEALSLSFFELTMGMAFAYFAQECVDIAVIEVGMGGRLDSTNIIAPMLSVITNISFDHTGFLGESIPEIAKEKAGIIKPNTPVIIGEMQAETAPIFNDTAIKNAAPIFYANQLFTIKSEALEDQHLLLFIQHNSDHTNYRISSPLCGSYQKHNIVTALAALQLLQPIFNLTGEQITDGFKNVIQNTHLQGRWQTINHSPLVICDTGHNLEGLTHIVEQLNTIEKHPLHFVLGMVNDKDIEALLEILPKNCTYYFCKANIPRGLDAAILAEKAMKHGLKGSRYPSVISAYQAALSAIKNPEKEMIFVGGSTFTVAEVL